MTSASPEAANGGRTDQRYRKQLRDLRSGDEGSSSDRIQQILQLGATRYGVELGLLMHVDEAGKTYTIDEVSASHPNITRGLTGDLLSTYCRMVVTEREPLWIDNTPAQGWAEDPAYQSSLLSTYIGTAVTTGDTVYGVVCFVDLAPRDTAFDDADCSFLERLAQAVSQILEDRAPTSTEPIGDPDPELSVVERPYQAALKHSPVTFAKVDAELRYEWICNPHSDVEPAAIIGKRDDELDSGAGIDQLVDLKRRALEQGKQIREEIVFECADGLNVYDVAATPLYEGAGDTMTGLITASLNVTDRKEQKRKLKESEARYRSLAENFPEGAVGVYDRDLRYTLVKGTLVGTVLPAAEEFEGSRVTDIFPQNTTSDIEPLFRAAVEDGTAGSVETTFGGRDWRVWANPLRDQNGTIFAGLSFVQDITEQKRREEAPCRHRNLLDQAQRLAGAWEVNLHTNEVTWSDTLYEIHEVPPGTDIDLDDALGYFPEEAREKLRAAFERCVETGASYDLELPLTTAEGNERWVRTVGAPGETEAGEVVEVAGAFQDITERKEAEQRRKQVIRRVTDAIVEVDADWRFTLVNDQAEALYDMSEEELLGEHFWDVFGEALGTRFEETYREVMRTREPGSLVEYYPGLNGWFDIKAYPNDDGGVAFYFQEITERKDAERELRQSERRFRKIFENAATGIVIGNEEGRLLRANPAFRSMLGYEENELRGRHFSEITHPDDIQLDTNLFEELIEGARDRFQMEKRYIRKNGNTFWGRLTVSLLDLDDEKKHVALVEDIDEQKRYEENLRRAKSEAEEAAQLKAVMLANMSHEVRTPLTSMIGFSGLLQDQLEGKPAKLARLVYKSGQRLEETMEAVLQLSQLEAGSYKTDRQTIRLAPLARLLADEFELQAKKDGIALNVEIGEESVEAYADETAVRHILSNVLDNALKFTPEGGRVTLRVRADDAGPAVVEVEDTGVGIAEEALPGVFEAFKQESEGLTREYEGAGLGLSIVQELVETLGGRIEVDTKKGEGTCIAVHLPKTSGPDASAA